MLGVDALPSKSLGSVRVKKRKEMNTFIRQGYITLIKKDSKDMYRVTKDFR